MVKEIHRSNKKRGSGPPSPLCLDPPLNILSDSYLLQRLKEKCSSFQSCLGMRLFTSGRNHSWTIVLTMFRRVSLAVGMSTLKERKKVRVKHTEHYDMKCAIPSLLFQRITSSIFPHGKPHHRTRVNCATESSLATSAIIPVKCAYWDFMTERARNNFSFARWWKQPRGNKKGILCFNYGENGTPNHELCVF